MNARERWLKACAEFLPSRPVAENRQKHAVRLRSKCNEVDLGIAVAHTLTKPGQRRELWEIAAFAGCSKQAISQIEQKALAKLRHRLREDPALADALREILAPKQSTSGQHALDAAF